MRTSPLRCIVKIRTCPVPGIMTEELWRGARARRTKTGAAHTAATIDPTVTLGTVGRGELDTAVAVTTKTFHNIVQGGPGVSACAVRDLKLLSPRDLFAVRRRGKGPFNCADRCQLDLLFLVVGLTIQFYTSIHALLPSAAVSTCLSGSSQGYDHCWRARPRRT